MSSIDATKKHHYRSVRYIERAILYLLTAVVCGLTVFPLYWMIVTALQTGSDLFSYPPKLLPNLTQLGVFERLVSTQPILLWLWNSSLVGFGAAGLAVFLSVFGGYSLSRFRHKETGFFGFLLLLTQMLPTVVILAPLFISFKTLGLLNTRVGLIIVNTAFIVPITTWVLKGYYDSLPYELEEAATIDGCSRLGAMLYVTMPLAAPAVVAAFVIGFFEAWNEYLFAVTFVSDRLLWVSSVGVASWIGELTTSTEIMMAGAALFCLPSLVFFSILQRYLVSGLAVGAVKQ